MNHDRRHDAIREDLPAYALNGLSPEEALAVEEHLAECASCREELLLYGPIPHALDLAVPAADLPEGARERMMQRTVTPVRAVPDIDETAGPAQPPHRRLPAMPWALAAASLLLAVVLGGGFLQQSRKAAEQQATIDSVVDLMERADLEVRDLPTPDSEARLRVYEAREGDVGMVVVDKLPDPPGGQEYQLWVGRGGELENEGTFVPTDAQRGSYHKLLKPPEGFARYDRVGIATVPEGGVESPPPASDPDWVVRAKL